MHVDAHAGSPPIGHVAIVMDGNVRWASARGLSLREGHAQGAQTATKIVKTAIRQGVSHLTLFGFSTENWNRPNAEVRNIFSLLSFYLREERKRLLESGIRFRVLGKRCRLGTQLRVQIEDLERETQHNEQLFLTIAFDYGGRDEILRAARKLVVRAERGEVSAERLSIADFVGALDMPDLPYPDLLIRTGGEQRISNFMLWQLAYSEFVFVDTLWPDFREEDFVRALGMYRNRRRRYGIRSSA